METPKKTGLVVIHSHWDREWRFPLWTTRKFLVDIFDGLLDIMDRDPRRYFLCDGQVSMIEDYLEIRPEAADRIRKHVKSGRLSIGPWYQLPDMHPLDGECLVRNLLRGVRLADSFGAHLTMAYTTFGWGQPAQFPQLLAGFGIDVVTAAKKVSTERAPKCEFIWEAPDGTQVLATRLGASGRTNIFGHAYMPLRYGIPYNTEEYKYYPDRIGLAYHEADADLCENDHFVIRPEDGYYPETIRECWDKVWHDCDETLMPDYRLLLSGMDCSPLQPMMERMVEDANKLYDDIEFIQGSLEEYKKQLLKNLDRSSLAVVRGELHDGTPSDGTYNALTTRMPIKLLNKKAENALLRQAEPMSAILGMMGDEYPSVFFDIAWKHLLQAHPHDTINGVTQDKTVEDAIYRIEQALEIGQMTYGQAVENLLKRIDMSGYKKDDVLLLVVNPLPFPARDVRKIAVDLIRDNEVWDFALADGDGAETPVQVVSRREYLGSVNDIESRPWPLYADRHMVYVDTGEIPAGGYKIFKVVPKKRFQRMIALGRDSRLNEGRDIARSGHTLENEFLRVEVQCDGRFTLSDKVSGLKREGLHYFEDSGDIGDYWVYYAPGETQTYTSVGGAARVWLEDNGPLSATIAIEVHMEIPNRSMRPQTGIQGESRRNSDMTVMPIVSRLTLKRGQRRLEIKTNIKNTAEDHRLRVMIPTDIKARFADAAGHFTVDRRAVIGPDHQDKPYFEGMQTLPQQCFVDVSDGKTGLGVINSSLTEYEVRNDDRATLALTFFRSMGNYICTQQKTHIHFPSQKGSKLLREMEFQYAIVPHEGDWDAAGLYSQARQFNVPPSVYQVSPSHLGGSLPPAASLFSLEPRDLVLSGFKKAEDRETWILRFFNPTERELEARIRTIAPAKSAWMTNLNEERGKELKIAEDGAILAAAPKKRIVTIELKA